MSEESAVERKTKVVLVKEMRCSALGMALVVNTK